jgi:ribonuclease R
LKQRLLMAAMPKKSPRDPHAKREAAKYENPIASRELIISMLEDAGKPLTEEKLARILRLSVEQEVALGRRLRAMMRDGQLIRNRRGAYGLVDKMDLKRGRVIGHKDGFGFVALEEGGDDLFLSPRQMRSVFDGDIVLVQQSGYSRRGQGEAVIVEVLERAHTHIVGRLHERQDYFYVTPDNNRISQQIAIPRKERGKAKAGQIVSVEILTQPSAGSPALGRITEVLGDHLAPGMEIDVAIRSHAIPNDWSAAVENELLEFTDQVKEEDKKGRVDLRHLPFVTIDGEDARDFDDAVYAERKKAGGWRLWVAIADVSHYVQVGSALDQEAANRGNSVYFPGRVVPMLPEILSNGLCSLNPNTDRLAMVCEMTVAESGRVSGYTFYEGLFRSAARLTYTKVAAFLDTGKLQNKKLHDPLRTLYDCYEALRGQREVRGAIDFESNETRIVFGEDQKIERIVPVERNEAHKLIEECMLAANVSAARFLKAHELWGLYRVHEGPNGDKLTNLREFLAERGLSLGGRGKPKPADYQGLSQAIAGRPDAAVCQTMMLRSKMQAQYQVEHEGHFGLAYTEYTHFTSPIRRYADLLVHRAIRSVIRSRAPSTKVQRVKGAGVIARKNIYPYAEKHLLAVAEHCSMTERRADDATRDVVAALKCEYLQEHIGDVFDGTVNAVTGFGLFVEIDELYVEGLVHVSALANDYYHFDAAKQRLQGERSGIIFGLGDKVTVRVDAVNIEDRKIDMGLVAAKASGKSARRSKAKGGDTVAKKGAGKNAGSRKKTDDSKPPRKKVKKAVKKKEEARKAKSAKKSARTVKRQAKKAERKAAKKSLSGHKQTAK